jgi:hypothetical protein
MTDTVLVAGDFASPTLYLTDAVVDSVTFADDVERVEVISLAGPGLTFTVDGSTPAIGEKNTHIVSAGAATEVDVPTAGPTVVRLVGPIGNVYRVTRTA